MPEPRYPSLYQVNTRVWLTELSRSLGRRATLDDVPDAELDRLAQQGFDWIWLLSVWQTGAAARKVSRSHAGWRREFEATLPDLTDADIRGSGFAITGYTVHQELGGDAALERFRRRLSRRGLKLMLDFVPNHMALDHPWVEARPDYFMPGSEEDLARKPQNFVRLSSRGNQRIFAYGRDPYFDGWPDTLQLNYANPELQEAMIGELARIARSCDGVRCDMAMLILPDVFERTWNRRPEPFWPSATARTRKANPGFLFMAEVYWDLEWTLQQQGFDYCYDKRLYDRLREGHARPVREHFLAGLDYQDKLARFLENHDEPRAAATFPPGQHEAAAILTYLSPGLRFFQAGQFEGKTIRISPHLGRGPVEPSNAGSLRFYDRLLDLLKQRPVREGHWRLLECRAAWEGNWTNDCIIVFAWETDMRERLLVVVNYAANQSQCYVPLPWNDLRGARWRLRDAWNACDHDRDGDELVSRGLYLDVPPWGIATFDVSPRPSTCG